MAVLAAVAHLSAVTKQGTVGSVLGAGVVMTVVVLAAMEALAVAVVAVAVAVVATGDMVLEQAMPVAPLV